MHRMNFSQAGIPEKSGKPTNPLLLFLASGICATWLIKSILVHIGM